MDCVDFGKVELGKVCVVCNIGRIRRSDLYIMECTSKPEFAELAFLTQTDLKNFFDKKILMGFFGSMAAILVGEDLFAPAVMNVFRKFTDFRRL